METTSPLLDPNDIDQKYASFPSFDKWNKLNVDVKNWDAALKHMETFKANDPGLLARAREVAKRAAAIDTGAIEGLYNVDDGFTVTVATQVGLWQNAYKAQEERTRNLIEAQLTGYDQVIDLATKGAPMVEAWIRGLHATLCAAQSTYTVITEQGEQQHELPLGSYKEHPNHVITKENHVHAYAPVLLTRDEMVRLLAELTSDEFARAHPVIQAAFAHYALVWIHPFADGNGRVARALASVYTYRSGSIPFMVLLEHKADYLASLRLADSANLQAYVDFVFKRGIDAFQLVAESLRAARHPSLIQGMDQAQRLHVTKGGYAHAAIDQAGCSLLQLVYQKASELRKPPHDGPIRISVDKSRGSFPKPPIEGQRRPADPNTERVIVRFDSIAPAMAQIGIVFSFSVPTDAAPDDHVIIITNTDESCFFTISSLLPRITTVTQLKLSMFLEGVWGAALEELKKKGRDALSKSGFA